MAISRNRQCFIVGYYIPSYLLDISSCLEQLQYIAVRLMSGGLSRRSAGRQWAARFGELRHALSTDIWTTLAQPAKQWASHWEGLGVECHMQDVASASRLGSRSPQNVEAEVSECPCTLHFTGHSPPTISISMHRALLLGINALLYHCSMRLNVVH